jgi:FtsH-binding integral membrane protein
MKKSRIMLTVVCLFAIIGGALALKVHHDKFIGTLYCAYTPTTSCTGLTTGVSLRITTTGDIVGYCTTVFGGMCTTEKFVINE